MGCYINPKDGSKENFLLEHGTPTSEVRATITETQVPVCLVDNGMFTAAGVAYDERELQAFKFQCGRPKMWFMVDRNKVREVSDLASYEGN